MPDPIVKEIEVPCGQRAAFEVFIAGMGSWWPLERFSVSRMMGGRTKELRVEAREGGRIVEVTPDGVEHLWGVIRTFAPPELLAMDFHITHPDHADRQPEHAFTLVEVRFTGLEEGRTRVRLEQREWERLGEMAGPARGGYGPAWTMILEEAYRDACGGAVAKSGGE